MCFRLGLHWNHADQYPFLGGSLGSSCMRGLPWSLSQNIDPSSLLSSIPVCISYVALCLCNSFVSYLLKCDIVLVDINEYSSSLCVNWATCTYFVNSYTCAFVSGYTGTHCESGGSLGLSTHYTHVIEHTMKLILIHYYDFPHISQCDSVLVDINECSSDPCMNGATCTDVVNSYTCTCAASMPAYSGTHCEIGGSFVWSNCIPE